MKLTDRTVKALKPAAARYEEFDDAVPGLAIRVNSGSKSFVLLYRERTPDLSGGFAPGKRLRRWTLGTYPALSLASARTKAQRALSELTTKGIDPAVGKREARNAQSFGELAADYMERHAKPNKKSWKEDQRKINADVLPYWDSRLVKTLTRKDVHDLLDRVRDRGTPIMANRVQAVVSRIFKYGIDRDWLDANPATRIQRQPEHARERILTDDELTALWKVLETIATHPLGGTKPPIAPIVARGLQLMLRTGQRAGEVFTMQWQDVDQASEWWTIPGTKAKNGQTHRVPLTAAARALLATVRPGDAQDADWVFAGSDGGSVAARAKKAIASLRAAGAIPLGYNRHDFRRTVTTGMASLGIAHSTLAHVLNQQEGGPRATAVYNRHTYDTEKRTALEAWGRHLDALLTGHPSRVVAFPGPSR